MVQRQSAAGVSDSTGLRSYLLPWVHLSECGTFTLFPGHLPPDLTLYSNRSNLPLNLHIYEVDFQHGWLESWRGVVVSGVRRMNEVDHVGPG